MKAYASENYYIGVYLCGKEPDISAAFDFYAMQATSLMKQYTLDNVDENDIPEEVKMCCCELCDSLLLTDGNGGMVKQSESVGSWSYTLASSSEGTSESVMVRAICRAWLPAEWLYRGVARE